MGRVDPLNRILRALQSASPDVEAAALAFFRGKEMVGQFLDWCEGLTCGIGVIEHVHRISAR